jgi:hypothetical protein
MICYTCFRPKLTIARFRSRSQSTRPTSTTTGSRASSGIAATSPVTSSSSTSMRTAIGTRSTRQTSMTICAKSPARRSPPKTLAPGPPPISPPSHRRNSSCSTPRRRAARGRAAIAGFGHPLGPFRAALTTPTPRLSGLDPDNLSPSVAAFQVSALMTRLYSPPMASDRRG